MTGEADFLLRVVVKDLQKYQVLIMECLTQIEGVASIRSSFALNQVKYTTVLRTAHPTSEEKYSQQLLSWNAPPR